MKLSILLFIVLFVISVNMVLSIRKKKTKLDLIEPDENDDDVVTSEAQLKAKMDKMKQNYDEKELSPKELAKLKSDEKKLRKEVENIISEFGQYSEQRATALHKLGGNMYKQGKFSEVLELAKEIVKIHEKKDGVEHPNTAKALGNLGESRSHYTINEHDI